MTKIQIVTVGSFWTDAGASFGNLPRSIWGRFLHVDDKHRMKLNLNLLLIQDNERNILVDTGIGNKLNEKMMSIFKADIKDFDDVLQAFNITTLEITDVVMTHLHFDHAGGIVSKFGQAFQLTFPNARYHIQEKEWTIAKFPDELNSAAYDYDNNLKLLEETGNINIINGDYKLTENVLLSLVGGHSEGMQIVTICNGKDKYIYAGDIIPSERFMKISITSAYDVCRRDTVKAKKMILDKVNKEGYKLIFDHSTEGVYYEA